MREWLLASTVMLVAAGAPAGPAATAPADRPLVVGTKVAPPFAMKDADGVWRGVSIDLWRQVADDLGVRYEFREYTLSGLLKGVKDGSIDVAAAALTVTAEREKAMDFTHPIHTTGLSVAVLPSARAGWLRVLRRFASGKFLAVVGALTLLLLVVGLLAWLFERRRNAAQFGGGAARGIGSGFWWSAVTMTTVGYGDKAPVTLGGRLVALVWMFTALTIVATLTGAIASALTVGDLEAAIAGPADLGKVRVGAVADSTSAAYLSDRHIGFRAYQTAGEGLRAVVAREIDAFVYDAPLLRWLAKTEMRGAVEVVPATFERQDYAFALPEGSARREAINRAILKVIGRAEWQDVLYRYLGP